MKETIQNLKIKREAMKNTQTKGSLGMEIWVNEQEPKMQA